MPAVLSLAMILIFGEHKPKVQPNLNKIRLRLNSEPAFSKTVIKSFLGEMQASCRRARLSDDSHFGQPEPKV